MRSFAWIGVVLLAVAGTGCFDIVFGGVQGSGTVESEQRDVGPFTRIDLTGSPDVDVRVGEPLEVIVETDDNLLPLIETRVEGDTLHVGSTKSYSTRKGVVIRVRVPSLESVSVQGSGDITATGVAGESFEAEVTGSGDIVARGTVRSVRATISGSGDIDLSDLRAEDAAVTVRGSGDIEVYATGELDASVVGSGDIRYRGDPSDVRREVTGSGDIVAR